MAQNAQRRSQPEAIFSEADGPPSSRRRSARGPVAGECLHAVFEHADFTDPDTWPAAIERALRAHPQVVPAQGETAARARLARLLGDVVGVGGIAAHVQVCAFVRM